jgi:hypothetical protein
MRWLSLGTICFAAGTILTAPAAAAAQDVDTMPVPAVEVTAGYMLMHDTVAHDRYPGGWYLSTTGNVSRWFGVVGEASGSYGSEDSSFLGGAVKMSTKRQVYALLGGGRFFHKAGRFVPFAQVLAGVASHQVQQTTTMVAEGPGGGAFNGSLTGFALQPGAGLSVYLTEHVGIRTAVDYRGTFDKDADTDPFTEVRFVTGFTFRWGSR